MKLGLPAPRLGSFVSTICFIRQIFLDYFSVLLFYVHREQRKHNFKILDLPGCLELIFEIVAKNKVFINEFDSIYDIA